MKFDIVRANGSIDYLTKKIKTPCENQSRNCDFHIFLHELLNIFVYNDLSLTHKKRCIPDLNERMGKKIDPFLVKMFLEYFDLVHY